MPRLSWAQRNVPRGTIPLRRVPRNAVVPRGTIICSQDHAIGCPPRPPSPPEPPLARDITRHGQTARRDARAKRDRGALDSPRWTRDGIQTKTASFVSVRSVKDTIAMRPLRLLATFSLLLLLSAPTARS